MTLLKIWRQFFLWISGTWLYEFVLKWVVPAIRFGGRPTPRLVREIILDRIRLGDVLVVKDRHKLTNILIGGEFSHCGMYLGLGEVGEMAANGYGAVSLRTFLSHSTKIKVLRLRDYDKKYATLMVRKFRMLGHPADYDIKFSLGIDLLACSEIIYHADIENRMKADLTDIAGLGRPYISPDGIAKAPGLKEWFDYEA